LVRFETLKSRIDDLAKPESKKRLLGLAINEYKTLLSCLGNLHLAINAGDSYGVMIASRNLASEAISCIAYINQRYMNKPWDSSMDEVIAMPKKPRNLEEILTRMVMSSDYTTISNAADNLATSVRQLIISEQKSMSIEANHNDVMRDFYNVIHEFANKIISRCDKGDLLSATIVASTIQEEIAGALSGNTGLMLDTTFNFYGEYGGSYTQLFPDLLDAVKTGDLRELRMRAVELKEKVQDWMSLHNISTNVVGSLDELTEFLHNRHQK
jgi:hypothetical protein